MTRMYEVFDLLRGDEEYSARSEEPAVRWEVYMNITMGMTEDIHWL